LSLRTKTLLLFLGFVLLPLTAVGVVAALGTQMAVHGAVQRTLQTVAGPEALRLEAASANWRQVVLLYVALVLLLGAAATLGFRVVTRRIFDSLEEFRGAAERIAEGDLTPWLPPPAADEVGWLSLSLGRMTERIGQMMQSIEQSGRLAVVGEMAAHVAHEVRTPLSSIKMNLQLLKRDADRALIPENARLSIDTSLSEIARLESIVTKTLEFGAPEGGLSSHCSLHGLIQDGADLVRVALEKRGIALRLDLGAESDWILADRGRIKGVFLNLLVNARDAMPDGGEISVETQLFLGDRGRQMLAAAVCDTGPGVAPALRERVFHPFFTTKELGCGIGLPGSLRTLREQGGDLFLSDRPDGRSGACFVVVLPLSVPRPHDVGAPYAGTIDVAIPGPRWRAPAALRWRRITEAQVPPTSPWAATDIAQQIH